MPPELSPRFLAQRIVQITTVALVAVLAVATLPDLVMWPGDACRRLSSPTARSRDSSSGGRPAESA